jgi:hypothetical protein
MKNFQLTILAAGILAAGSLALSSCHKDGGDPSGAQDAVMVTASLGGRVVDEEGVPVQGAAVASSSTTATTDANGMFHFDQLRISSLHGVVKVVKGGYFTGSRTVVTHEGGESFVTIRLIPRQQAGNFQGGSGGTVQGPSGTSIQFASHSVVMASGNGSYNGTVHVYAAYLDPTDAHIGDIMPGDLRGLRLDGTERGLQSFGMMAVELEGDGGEKLQIAPGMKAGISLPIPASLRASAPATIPLWHFSDSTGLWVEEGTATRQGDSYIGEVGHFSYWNCDLPIDLVKFKVKLKDMQGHPLAYTRLDFVSMQKGTRGGYTDADGFAEGLLPKGESFLLNVTGTCGLLLYSENIGTVTADKDLGTLTATQAQPTLSLHGTVVDCQGAPVINGYVNILVDGYTYRPSVHNGDFSFNLGRCSGDETEVKLTAVNSATAQQGDLVTRSFATGSHDLGQLTACGNTIEQIVNFTINGANYTLASPPDTLQSTKQTVNSNEASYLWVLLGWGNAGGGNELINGFGLAVEDIGDVGVYSVRYMSVTVSGKQYTNTNGQGSIVQCTVTSVGEPLTGYVEGTFSGMVSSNADGTSAVPLSGNFKVLRTF